MNFRTDWPTAIKGLKLEDPFLRIEQVIARHPQAYKPGYVLYEGYAIVCGSVP
jgi:hypothetical protein